MWLFPAILSAVTRSFSAVYTPFISLLIAALFSLPAVLAFPRVFLTRKLRRIASLFSRNSSFFRNSHLMAGSLKIAFGTTPIFLVSITDSLQFFGGPRKLISSSFYSSQLTEQPGCSGIFCAFCTVPAEGINLLHPPLLTLQFI